MYVLRQMQIVNNHIHRGSYVVCADKDAIAPVEIPLFQTTADRAGVYSSLQAEHCPWNFSQQNLIKDSTGFEFNFRGRVARISVLFASEHGDWIYI